MKIIYSLAQIEEMMKEKDIMKDQADTFCFFAIGDTFGNVAFFKQEILEKGAKSRPLFIHRNTEIGYSIESLNFDVSGNLLWAATSKHFFLLFYLGMMDQLTYVKKVSSADYFRQNSLSRKDLRSLGMLSYKDYKDISQPEMVVKKPVHSVQVKNKPVFFRKSKGPVAKPQSTFQKKPNASQVNPSATLKLPFSQPYSTNNKVKFVSGTNTDSLVEVVKFVSVRNLLSKKKGLFSDKVIPFTQGVASYCLKEPLDDNQNLRFKTSIIQPKSGMDCFVDSQINNSGFLDNSQVRSCVKVWFNRQRQFAWSQEFEGPCTFFEANDNYVVLCHKESKLKVLRIKTGRKVMLSIEAPNLFCISLNNMDRLLLVRRNGFFSIIDITKGKVDFSGNCFELIDSFLESPEVLLTFESVHFLLSPQNKVFLKICNSIYIYNQELQMWQEGSHSLMFGAFNSDLYQTKQFNLSKFPNDPSEIFDCTPFTLLATSSDILQKFVLFSSSFLIPNNNDTPLY